VTIYITDFVHIK